MFGTPGFGNSDIWHLNFPLKFLLSNALKNGYLPFWSKDIGTGFPVFAEGQIGLMNIFNLILFRAFEPVTAFNIEYLFVFLTAFIGSYLYARAISLSKTSSLYLSTVFSVSGFFITHAFQINLIQTVSFFPWLILFVEKYSQKPAKKWLFGLTFVVTQQIFSGFPQFFLISSGFLVFYIFLRKQQGYLKRAGVIYLGAAILFGIAIASPQLLATLKLTQLSPRSKGLDTQFIASFPFNPKNLINYIDPYFWGDPRKGTYPAPNENWGFYWENTPYIGIVPVVLFIIALIKRGLFTDKHYIKGHLIVGTVGLVLGLGKYTPLFFLVQLPVLSLFRVPSRYLLLTTWTIVVISALFLDKIQSLKIKSILVLISASQLLIFAISYNPIISTQAWLEPPETVKAINNDVSWYRVFSVLPDQIWYNELYANGWKSMEKYRYFRNSLDANQNILWKLASADYYAALAPKRNELWKQIFKNGIVLDIEQKQLLISSQTAKLADLAGIKYLISPYSIQDKNLASLNWQLISTVKGKPNYFIYRNPDIKPHAYLTSHYVNATDIEDLYLKITDASSSAAVIEESIKLTDFEGDIGFADVTTDEDLRVEVATSSNRDSLLILTDTYYPGWEATVDGIQTKIFPVNMNQRAVILPAGKHRVIFKFDVLKSL